MNRREMMKSVAGIGCAAILGDALENISTSPKHPELYVFRPDIGSLHIFCKEDKIQARDEIIQTFDFAWWDGLKPAPYLHLGHHLEKIILRRQSSWLGWLDHKLDYNLLLVGQAAHLYFVAGHTEKVPLEFTDSGVGDATGCQFSGLNERSLYTTVHNMNLACYKYKILKGSGECIL